MEQYIKDNYVTYIRNKRISISKIVLNQTGVYLVFDSENSISTPGEKNKILNTVFELLRLFETNMYNVIIYHRFKNNLSYINTYNDSIIKIEDNIDVDIKNKTEERVNIFDEAKLSAIQEIISFTCETNSNIKCDSQGNVYVRKNKKWFKASEEDSEKRFWITVFGGCFGVHKFSYGKKSLGLLYLLTCGLFGLGWFFDLLEMILGISKDKDGLYLCPLKDRKKKILVLIGVIVVAIVLLYLYFLMLSSIGKLLN